MYCPLNEPDRWWDKIKSKLADNIRAHLEVKNRMSMHVPEEDKIGTCHACFCNLPLKVWAPVEHVAAHTTQDVMARFPKACWQRHEIEHLNRK